MKTLILSPLFPPDTGAPATYVKELAAKIQEAHEVTILLYGYLPESVTGATCLAIDKRSILPLRLLSFTKSLFTQMSNVDIVLVNNAPSIELPLLFVTLFRHTPYVLIESDPLATQSAQSGLHRLLHGYITKRAKKIVTLGDEASYTKAEILPFVEFDAAREARRQDWWNQHLITLLS